MSTFFNRYNIIPKIHCISCCIDLKVIFFKVHDINLVGGNNSHGTTVSRIYLTEFFMRKFRSRIKCLSGRQIENLWPFLMLLSYVVIYYENVLLALASLRSDRLGATAL